MTARPTDPTWLDAIAIVDVIRGVTSAPSRVRIDGGRIAAIEDGERDSSGAGRYPDEGRIDGRGLFLAPGLIDAHVHLFLDGGARPREQYLAASDEERVATAHVNARSALAAGVTTVCDLGAPAEPMWELQATERSGAIDAPHIVSAGAPITRLGGHVHFFGGEVDSHRDVQTLVERQIDAGAGIVKLIASGGGMTPGTDPNRAELPLDWMRTAVETAHRRDIPVTAHCHATESIARAVNAGVDIIEHASFVDPSGVHRFDEPLATRLRDADIAVDPSAVGALRTAARHLADGQPENPADRQSVARLQARLTNVRDFRRIGVTIIGGTDGGATDTGFDAAVEEIGGYVTMGMTPAEALRTVTSEAAARLRLERVGVVAVGYRADLLVLDSDPLLDLAALRRPRMVLKDGRIAAVAHPPT